MTALRLLIVEDDERDLQSCRNSIARYRDEKHRDIDLVECRSVDEALDVLDNSFDAAIIDLKLGDAGDEGNSVANTIEQLHLRIPVAILTGTPDATDTSFAYIGTFKKGDPGSSYTDLLDRFWRITSTGLTRIMGGRGVIEATLNKVFRDNILPQIDRWVVYGDSDPERTEKALLRYTLSHLHQLLDDGLDRSFPEEVYLAPPLAEHIQTGSIIKERTSELWSVVMNPACDLVIRGHGNFKTDRILLVEIDNDQQICQPALEGISNKHKREKKLATICGNNHTDYYHWLPKTDFFGGGFINFRKLRTVSKEFLGEHFEGANIQITAPFVKDIVSRFSSYYARQGQPDIDHSDFISLLATEDAN